MRTIAILLISALFLSGCATYKFHHGEGVRDQGYVVARDNYVILEYTQGMNGSTPDLPVAKERFNRRKSIVNHYYKRMGYIEDRFKEDFWDPVVFIGGFIIGIFRMPFIVVSTYRYEHNPQYRARADKIKDEEYAREEARITSLKEKLRLYVENDLRKEGSSANALMQPKVSDKTPLSLESAPEAMTVPVVSQVDKELLQPQIQEKLTLKSKTSTPIVGKTTVKRTPVAGPVAIIIARPLSGTSPLKVNFYGSKSYSANSKIISYEWKFGDGDSSNKKNTVNTFLSTTYGSRFFNVTLTITDDKGRTAIAERVVEVITK